MDNYNLIPGFLFCILPYILIMSFMAYYGHKLRAKTAEKIITNTNLLQQDPSNLHARKQINRTFMMVFVGMIIFFTVLLSFVFFMISNLNFSFALNNESSFFLLIGGIVVIFSLLGGALLLFITFRKIKKWVFFIIIKKRKIPSFALYSSLKRRCMYMDVA